MMIRLPIPTLREEKKNRSQCGFDENPFWEAQRGYFIRLDRCPYRLLKQNSSIQFFRRRFFLSVSLLHNKKNESRTRISPNPACGFAAKFLSPSSFTVIFIMILKTRLEGEKRVSSVPLVLSKELGRSRPITRTQRQKIINCHQIDNLVEIAVQH